MNKIQILKKARKLIEGDEQFLCHAIAKVVGASSAYDYDVLANHHNAEYLIELIAYKIRPAGTVNNWLDQNYPGQFDAYDEGFMRKYRLAWIDMMIGQIKRGEL